MPVLLELPLDLLVNMLPIRFSIHALEVATEIKTPTTEFLEETLETFFWELLEDLLQLLSLMLLLEVLVEDKNISSLMTLNHGRTKYGMATLFQIDQATFICRQ